MGLRRDKSVALDNMLALSDEPLPKDMMAEEGRKPDELYDSSRDRGLRDLILGLQRSDMWTFLAVHDIRQRYRRSLLGPFWITIVLAAQVLGIGLLYSTLMKQEMSAFLPYLAGGLTVWYLIAGLLVEGSNIFINSAASVRSVVAPISIHVFRLICQHLIIFAHNLVVLVIVMLLYQTNPGIGVVTAIPGLVLCVLNLGWMVLLLGTASARFRDIPLIVSSLMLLMLIMTPIFWRPGMLGPSSLIVQANPLYHLLEIVRGPLTGLPVPIGTWIGLAGAAVIGWAITIVIYNRLHRKIPFWV